MDEFIKHQKSQPLFPDILWERPERRDLAGRLLIVGGSNHGLQSVALAYQTATDSGIGQARVLIPESLRKLTRNVPNVDYGETTTTGAFSLKARETLMFHAQANDGVLLAGDIGRSSETSLLFSEFCKNYNGPLTITKDVFEAVAGDIHAITQREQTLLVITLAQLRRLATEVKSPEAISLDLDYVPLLERLHRLSAKLNCLIITRHYQKLIAMQNGHLIVSDTPNLGDIWRVETAAKATTFWLQHRHKPLAAIATACLEQS